MHVRVCAHVHANLGAHQGNVLLCRCSPQSAALMSRRHPGQLHRPLHTMLHRSCSTSSCPCRIPAHTPARRQPLYQPSTHDAAQELQLTATRSSWVTNIQIVHSRSQKQTISGPPAGEQVPQTTLYPKPCETQECDESRVLHRCG